MSSQLSKSPVYRLLTDRSNKRGDTIGVEVERLVRRPGQGIVHYEPNMRRLFDEMVAEQSWESAYEFEGQILAVKKSSDYISLEPGGQLEISAAPQEKIFDVWESEKNIEAQVLATREAQGWKWLWIAVNPFEKVEDIKIIPSPRYQIMTDYFPTVGKRGLEMMRLTTGFHLNLDFHDEAGACDLLRTSFAIVPELVGFLANSPYEFGSKTGNLSERSKIWADTDPARSGAPSFVFSDFGFKHYVDYVESVPLMYVFTESGLVEPGGGRSLRELPENLREPNALSAMRQIFTEARLKPCCVELRCFDQQTPERRYAAVALAVGLLYDESNRREINLNFKSVTQANYLRKLDIAARAGMQNDELFESIKKYLSMAEKALVRRGFGEEELLEPLVELIRLRKTPAELMMEADFLEALRES